MQSVAPISSPLRVHDHITYEDMWRARLEASHTHVNETVMPCQAIIVVPRIRRLAGCRQQASTTCIRATLTLTSVSIVLKYLTSLWVRAATRGTVPIHHIQSKICSARMCQ